MSDILSDVQNAINNVLASHGDMTISWVLCAEVIDEDGERGAWLLAQPDQKPWITKGLLEHARDAELARTIKNYLEED